MKSLRQIPGYEGIFEIDSEGQIFRLFKGRGKPVRRPLKGTKDKDGYLRVCLSVKQTKKYISVHRLVALAFLPNPENKKCVNHKNGIKTDNNVANLEWVSALENNVHALKTGLRVQNSGELHHRSRLSNEQRKIIARMYKTQNYSQKQLGIQFGVSQTQIHRILRSINT